MQHELKTCPYDFKAVARGWKCHEARRADRPFAAMDELILLEWIPEDDTTCDWRGSGMRGKFTGRALQARVTHLTQGQYQLPSDLAIMSIPASFPVYYWTETRRWVDTSLFRAEGSLIIPRNLDRPETWAPSELDSTLEYLASTGRA